jgi:hypothetical protein
MAITLTTLPQMDSTEAAEAAAAANEQYAANELNGIIIAKTGQADAYFSTTMPLTREEEYNAASVVDQNKFALIGALANLQVSKDHSKTFLVAWEEQYTIMFG